MEYLFIMFAAGLLVGVVIAAWRKRRAGRAGRKRGARR